MKKKSQTYLALPEEIRRMAGMSAARMGKSLSAYVADLVRKDADNTGIAKLVEQGEVQ